MGETLGVGPCGPQRGKPSGDSGNVPHAGRVGWGASSSLEVGVPLVGLSPCPIWELLGGAGARLSLPGVPDRSELRAQSLSLVSERTRLCPVAEGLSLMCDSLAEDRRANVGGKARGRRLRL